MKVLVAATGSLGDLHPHLAVALALRDRGHEATVATSEAFRARVEAMGLAFVPMPPDVPDWRAPGLVSAMMDARRGTERVVRDFALPELRNAYAAILPEVARSDAVVCGLLAFAARLAAERSDRPWFSTALQPSVMFSTEDPPVIPGVPLGSRIGQMPAPVRRGLFGVAELWANRWTAPVTRFREELGLPPVRANPLLRGQHSPWGSLALFSPLLAASRADWPGSVRECGYPFDRRVDGGSLPSDLLRFLESGPDPVVFTLGSAASLAPGDFPAVSLVAAREAGMRAIVLAGPDAAPGPSGMGGIAWVATWLPHAEIFSRASIIVHHGGIGTLSHALAAGRPMLVVPHAHDQPDNARRARDLGVARVLERGRYRSREVAATLRDLARDSGYRDRASAIAAAVRQERGGAVASGIIEEVLARG